jgi:glycerol uptake facilitator-like aquaporin
VTGARPAFAEGLGTALLLAIVVGSGIMGERLAAGNDGVALLANSIATGAGLYVLIVVFGPLSGAHFNPAVSLAMAVRGALPARALPGYLLAQVAGALLGVVTAHLMFGLPPLIEGVKVRTGAGQWLAEFVATFGLLFIIVAGARHRPQALPALVACWIVAAYWFTASTSFANPAVTLARAATDTFAGIRPLDVPGFVIAQMVGALAGAACAGWLCAPSDRQQEDG